MPDTDDRDPERPITASERASLLREFDDLRQKVADLHAERQQTRDQLYQTLRGLGLSAEEIENNVRSLTNHGMTRRAAMVALVGAVGGVGFMSGQAAAAASTSDGDGDVGTPANPVDVFADGVDAVTVDADAVTIDGDDALKNSGEAATSPGFGSWRTPDANRPVLLSVEASAETDGTNPANVNLQVDKSGGTTADYTFVVVEAEPALGNGAALNDQSFTYLPPGGAYQIVNANDPNAGNSISDVREATL